jgi:hypothetical protein
LHAYSKAQLALSCSLKWSLLHQLIHGSYAAENLGPPVKPGAGEYEAFVTEDERLILLAITKRPDSLGGIDLYVSHKQADGKWGEPANLGPEVNSTGRELSPKLTPNGKYLIWMSCRVPALPAKPRRRSTTERLQELHAPGTDLETFIRSMSLRCRR